MTHSLLRSVTFTGPGRALRLKKTYKGSLWTWTPSQTHPPTLSTTSPLKRQCGPAFGLTTPPRTNHHTWHAPSQTATPLPLQSKQLWQKGVAVLPPSYASCAPVTASTQTTLTTSIQMQAIIPPARAHTYPADLTTHTLVNEHIATQKNMSYSTASKPCQPETASFKDSDHYASSFSHRT
jgi:hypothetical protein